MRPDCQLRAFNAEVTGSCTIALSPCFHSCPSTLVLLFGRWRGWLWWIAYCPFFSGQELPRTRRSSAISPSSCGPSLVILGRFPPRLGPRAYYSEWTGAPRSFGPTVIIYHGIKADDFEFKPSILSIVYILSYEVKNFPCFVSITYCEESRTLGL